MSAVLVIAEHDGTDLAATVAPVVGAALQLRSGTIDLAVLGDGPQDVAAAAATIAGVDRVLVLDRTENHPCLAAVWAPQIAALAVNYSHVLAPATTFGKDLLPRVAALLGVGMLSDVNGIEATDRFTRPVYAGNAIVRVRARTGSIVLATIRPTAFAAPAASGEARVEAGTTEVELPDHTRFIERRGSAPTGPDLQTARRVVAGGRGLGSAAGFELIDRLATLLDAAVAASRAAVDAGWVANDLQVGQTGRIIAPELYIAVGISGAIQHLTGIRDAGTIVAINADPEAPIGAIADYSLVADLFASLPELIERLQARREGAG